MRILIIEDEKELALAMKEGLLQFGFICDLSFCGNEGEEKAMINEYDALLLDLNLPDQDGLEVLRKLRRSEKSIPIIIVTARDDVIQRAQGLDLGADDYRTKPFDFVELRARLQAVIRRFYGRSQNDITVGSLNIDPKTRIALFQEEQLNLTAKEFDILEYICSRYPEVVSSEDICEHIYDEFFDPFSSVVRVHISNWKKKLKNIANQEVRLTIKGKGYRLCDEFTQKIR